MGAPQEGGYTWIMDITVSHLNERMALRVPSELPLGLVFIVGQVEAIRPYPQNPEEVTLQLTDEDHSLPCRLPQQVADEMQLSGDERVRAGGHLVFDKREARYYLLARDIEVLPSLVRDDEEETTLPPPAVASVQEPEDGHLVAAELPPWVRQLAPPEVQWQLGVSPAPAETDIPVDDEVIPLPAALIDYLSQAIDSDQEIELTPSLVHELLERYSAEPPDETAAEPEPVESYEIAGEAVEVGVAGKETLAYADDDAVPAPDLPASVVEPQEVSAAGEQKRGQSSPRRQTFLLVAGVASLFIFILLVFVVIALAAGYTPSFTP